MICLWVFSFFLFLWCLDSWESPSGPCAPKPCHTSNIPKHVRRVSMRIILFYLSCCGLRGYVSSGVPEDRASFLSASACPMNHMPSFTLWRDPGCVAKLWSLLTAVPLFSKWGMLLITGLSAASGKMIVYDSPHFPHAILCVSATCVSYK